ncbi:MAG TPA: transglycosylase domain-containing protein [Ktedonobacterales bacterium]
MAEMEPPPLRREEQSEAGTAADGANGANGADDATSRDASHGTAAPTRSVARATEHSTGPLRYRRSARYVRFSRRVERQRRRGRRGVIARVTWSTLGGLLLLVVALAGGSLAAAASYYQAEQPAVAALASSVANHDSVQIFDNSGHLLYELDRDGVQRSIDLAHVPVTVVNATLAIEDHSFWTNTGVDLQSIVRAALADYHQGGIVQGGSTITQQVVKNQVLGDEVTFSRKLEEAILAVGLTTSGVYSKQQILSMYLNSVPYSPTAYGIDAAAHYYFGYNDDPATGETAAQQLDLAQASMLAGIPQNPSLNDPLLHPQAARTRQSQVLDAMVSYGYITRAQANAAWAEAGAPHFYHPALAGPPDLAPHFVNYVLQQVESMIELGQLSSFSRSGLRIYTTLDLALQQHTQQAITQHLFGNDITDFAAPTYIRNDNVTNAAALLADQHTGAIVAYVGSADYNSDAIGGQFDTISQGYRSPGSSFKPFVYATAFEKGWFPAMTVGDVPTAFWDGGLGPYGGQSYRPLDYDAVHATGTVTLRTALDWSLNIPAVRVMQYAGIQDTMNTVERMGITSWRGTWGLASVLGALDVTPFEMAQAYTVFANYGQYIPLHAINAISDSAGDVLYQYAPPMPVQVMDPRIAFLITSILTDNASRAGDFGGCSPLYLDPYMGLSQQQTHYTFNAAYGSAQCGYLTSHRYLSPLAWPTAAKTGTAQDFRDDWTMGYTMDYTAAVWVGNNNDTPMINIDGISAAAPIWYSTMLYAEEHENQQRKAFPVPPGVHLGRYCSAGVCTTDWFLDGTTLDSNVGESGDALPCVSLLPAGGWVSSGSCQVSLEHKQLQNAGAPTDEVKYVGAP